MAAIPGRLPDAITQQHYRLSQSGKAQAEYVWVDGTGIGVRSKTKTLERAVSRVEELGEWNYDGSSTGQAPGSDSEVILRPKAIYRDPFRGGDNILVLCATYTPQGQPLPTNHRDAAEAVFDQARALRPWYGFEQEFTLFETDRKTPFGWPSDGTFPAPQGPYYCSAGAEAAFGRAVVEAHYRACLYAGVGIAGCNAEVMPGQWEFQVGPVEGIRAGDDLTIARYLLLRVAELFSVVVSFDPKPVPGDWNGAGMHTNFSTEPMRQDGGYDVILQAIQRLGDKHAEHVKAYGVGNERRLTGRHETSPLHEFSFGVANRGASVRIPRSTEKDKKGYFEDRRPASTACPYLVSALIFQTSHSISVPASAPTFALLSDSASPTPAPRSAPASCCGLSAPVSSALLGGALVGLGVGALVVLLARKR